MCEETSVLGGYFIFNEIMFAEGERIMPVKPALHIAEGNASCTLGALHLF